MQLLLETYWLVAAAAGLLLGILLVALIKRGHSIKSGNATITRLNSEISTLQNQLSEKSALTLELATQLAAAEEKVKHLQSMEPQLQQLRQQLLEERTANVELQTRAKEQAKNTEEKLRLLQDADHRLTVQFENLANNILESKGKQWTERQQTSLNHIVNPLKEQLGEFKQRIETVYDNETKDRISLREEIALLKQQTLQVTKEANNLVHALKGDKKTQGNWGEMILEKVLEQSGLRKGFEYQTQGGYRDADNQLFKPDVIVRLPENKDVVIDSKVSLLAYEQYCSEQDETQKSIALQRHIHAVRAHIKSLSNKDYSSLKGLRSLDFVLLFMPIEAAFMTAFENDEKLFTDAFEHKIVVVTPTTLLATLRTIENIWRYERQNENARLIADKAGILYDKIRGFVEDLDKLGNQLHTVNKTYDGVMNKLTHGNGNLIRQSESFVELGVKVKKSFPKNIADQAGLTIGKTQK